MDSYTLAGAIANQVPPKNRELAAGYMRTRALDSLLLSSNRDPAMRGMGMEPGEGMQRAG
ncbi:hypothetical protein SCLCIDRAFT_1218865 [Scleroderma citrinum Foug A]|uniref:Uncharacterized protein n=1 Tax=Scleroderma citrinum Foug A TaxID=1036808 RepID=A0A0C3A0C6_9AGAM|nr:hypothetical protein SCLCIDRAFT_1218865 [Scleroderma citrinum Foug A]